MFPSILRRPAASLALVAAAAAGCRSAPEATPDLPGAVKVPASEFPLDGRSSRAKSAADPEGPVTHLGRNVFPKCHRMIVGEVVSTSRAGLGTEIVRVRERELLWGPPADDEAPYNVLCGATGLAPGVGGRALFLLQLLPAGEFRAVEVAPVDDADGPSRLRAFRTYLTIEGVDDPDLRRELLLAYLRSAAGSSDTWARGNAVREYAAFAKAFPGALRTEDGAVLSKAIPSLKDPELRRLAKFALDEVPTAPGPRRPATPATAGGAAPAPARPDAAALAPFEARYAAPRADASARRAAILDATVALDAGASPLVGRGLADRDAPVREIAAAAAGQTAMREHATRLQALAASDPSEAVRRSAVMALGHVRATGAVQMLGGLATSEGGIAREALFALARIRDDAALAALRSLRASLPTDLRRDVDFLLSEDFVKQERAMGARWPGL